ncbi:hypothetical protein [Kaarinaea lacus]
MKKNKIILGSAISIAAIAVAIDHTRHKLPEPQLSEQGMAVIQSQEDDSPCGMGDSPCGLGEDESPCGMSMDESPCGMGGDESPCGMGETPCGM